MTSRAGPVAALCAAIFVCTPARAPLAQVAYIKGSPPTDRIYYRNTSVLRANPIGLMNEVRIGYRHRIYDSDSPLLKNGYVGLQAVPFLSPAFARIGLGAEFAPLSILQLSAMYEHVRAFGTFGTQQSFPSAASDASAAHAVGPIPGDENYASSGWQATFGALVQMKLPPPLDVPGIVVRNNFRLMRVDQDLRDGDRVYYDLIFDVIAPGSGWFAVNDADLLYMFGSRLSVGVRYTYTAAFYTADHIGPGELIPNNDTHRLGPLISYSFFPPARIAGCHPTMFVLVNFWAKHPYRTGRSVSAGVPYVLVGLSLTGDLFSWKRDQRAAEARTGQVQHGTW